MIRGIDKFRQHFAGFEQHYVLIGGVASALVMEAAGLEFRATRDFDMVLCVEALDPAFGKAFWDFVKQGGYQNVQRSTGERIFYRFDKPADPDFPYMLELFSRNPDHIRPAEDSHLTPLPIDEAVSSLSAILLNEDYYNFLHQHIKRIDGISVVSEFCLIPLKASAWLDLTRQVTDGVKVDDKNIRKHKNDVLRLFQVLTPDTRIALPPVVGHDLTNFLRMLQQDSTLDLKQFGLAGLSREQVVTQLIAIYQLPPIAGTGESL
jgi:hypothetical protein